MDIKLTKQGLAVDIDETLSWTIGFWVAEMQKRFGNPENLTITEMIEKYRYVQNVPYWQTEDVYQWTHEQIHSNDLQIELPLIEGANDSLREIEKIVPIATYITIRPEVTRSGTQRWLDKHNFPRAPLISKPTEIPHEAGSKWKAATLARLYPQISGLIDDNAAILDFLPADYPGTIFLYDHHTTASKLNVIPCKTWPEVIKKVKEQFA
jgi:hypothetical protein